MALEPTRPAAAAYHAPIMVAEVLALLAPERGGVFVDGTLGGGGHAEAILRALPIDGRLYGIDRDADAIQAASERLKPFGERFTAIRGNFFDMKSLLSEQGVAGADGILLDLGVSSHQLDEAERGFSYKLDAPLDMRMDQNATRTAAALVNGADEAELCRIFRDYGEERFAGRIAHALCLRRQEQPFTRTVKLADAIKATIPAKFRNEPQHPARRCFQALRIAVNGELDGLAQAITDAHDLLKPGGRMAVLSFHSLEDRIVKTAFRGFEQPCTCPKELPVCVCGKLPTAHILTRKPIEAGEAEQAENSRSSCAKLRAIEKVFSA